MAVNAYTVALVQNRFGAATPSTLPASLSAGVGAAAAAGAVIGVAAARLRGPYLAGLTLVVAIAVPALSAIYGSVFHGDQGLPVYLLPAPDALGVDFPFERWQSWLALAAALLTMLLLANLTTS